MNIKTSYVSQKIVMIQKITLLLILFTGFCKAQIDADQIRMAYLLKIAGDFDWEITEEPLKMGFFSNDRDFYLKYKEYVKNKSISGRPVELIIGTSAKKIHQFDIVYFEKEKINSLKENIGLLENKKTLVFTNSASDMSFTMINLYTSYDKKLKFKINSSLLRSHEFNPSNLMVILGGSDQDIFSLFEAKDSSIRTQRNRALALKKRNKMQENQLVLLENKISGIKKSLERKSEEVILKSAEIETVNSQLNKQEQHLDSITKKIVQTTSNLTLKETQIRQQEKKLRKQVGLFNQQKIALERQENKISEQDVIISERETLLNSTQENLFYTFFFSVILLAVLMFAILSFLGKRKSNKKLELQNHTLQSTLKELKTTQAKLVQNEKMASLGMVTAGMAHEINNPITFVYAGVNVLKKELNTYNTIISKLINDTNNDTIVKDFQETSSSADQTISDIELGAKRVTEIIQSLQNFSRLNEHDLKTIELSKAIDSTLTILGSHARKKKISIEVQTPDTPIFLNCFPASINQVFVNLLSNSIDAVKENIGKIKITSQVVDRRCYIQFIDNGVGISKENITKIFDPFYTTKKIGEGTGLGLSISYNIVKKHHGNLVVQSIPHEKTCFKIELPLDFITDGKQ